MNWLWWKTACPETALTHSWGPSSMPSARAVRAMWLMVQRETPGDYVIATGESHSVRELVEAAFGHVDLDWEEHVRIDESLVRGKAELYDLVGNSGKAREELGWSPTVEFEELVHMLVDADLDRLRSQLEPAHNVL